MLSSNMTPDPVASTKSFTARSAVRAASKLAIVVQNQVGSFPDKQLSAKIGFQFRDPRCHGCLTHVKDTTCLAETAHIGGYHKALDEADIYGGLRWS